MSQNFIALGATVTHITIKLHQFLVNNLFSNIVRTHTRTGSTENNTLLRRLVGAHGKYAAQCSTLK